MIYLLLIFGAVGHVILWVMLVNRLHALGMDRRWIDVLTGLCGVGVAVIPLAVAAVLYQGWFGSGNVPATVSAATWSYIAGCAVLSIIGIVRRVRMLRHPERGGVVLANHTSHIKLSKDEGPLAAPGVASWLAHLPLNQALDITVHEEQLKIPRLSAQYEGVRVAHLSDLHMSGRITKKYFERMVEHVNRCEADVITITGDLVEREKCLDWIPDTLGRLHAPGGVFYVLGNHDRHVDEMRLHAALADAGLTYVGGTWRQIAIRNVPLILAGNEVPWYPPAADLSDCPPHDAAGVPLRILLSHSPDQFAWAQQHEVDLMLAGHNHGGQVCLPLLGAILAPSMQGVRYASGAFRAGNTVLHVSRGTSCLTPIRYNCPPEIALLVLRAGA